MLDVNIDNVCRLIELAREFHAQDGVIISDEPTDPGDDWQVEILAAHSSDAYLAEFRSVINDLEPRQQQEVVGLLWTGRGDFDLEEWEDVLSQAADAWNERTAEYLLAHPMLAEYLTEGLDLHGYRCD